METNTTNKTNKNKKYSASKSSNKKTFNKKSSAKTKKPTKNKQTKNKPTKSKKEFVDVNPVDYTIVDSSEIESFDLDPNNIYEVYPDEIIKGEEPVAEPDSGDKYSRVTNPFSVDNNPKVEKFVNFLQGLITVSTLGFVIGAVCKLFGIISWPWYLIVGIGYLPALIIIGIFTTVIGVVYSFFFIYMILLGIPRNFLEGFSIGLKKVRK